MVTLTDNMRGSALMAAAMAAFTINDACMKAVTATGLPLFQAILLRGVLTLVAIAVIGGLKGGLRLRFGARDSRIIAWRSVGEVGGTVFFLTALVHMPLATMTAILQSLPLAVTLAAAFFFRERVGLRRMLAILIGFAGVMMIIRPGSAAFDFWAIMGLISVAFVVLRDLSTRRLSAAVPSVSVAFYAALSVTVMAAVVTPFTGWSAVPVRSALLVATASGFLIMGYLFVVMAMRVGEVSLVAPFRYTGLVWAIVLGWVVFGDFPDGWTLAGAAIVVGTGIYAFNRERRLGQQIAIPVKAPLRVR